MTARFPGDRFRKTASEGSRRHRYCSEVTTVSATMAPSSTGVTKWSSRSWFASRIHRIPTTLVTVAHFPSRLGVKRRRPTAML